MRRGRVCLVAMVMKDVAMSIEIDAIFVVGVVVVLLVVVLGVNGV